MGNYVTKFDFMYLIEIFYGLVSILKCFFRNKGYVIFNRQIGFISFFKIPDVG
jgi:hypothetical protein